MTQSQLVVMFGDRGNATKSNCMNGQSADFVVDYGIVMWTRN
jgi:hypothetical protein